MSLNTSQAIPLFVAVVVVWRLVRSHFYRSALSEVAGPSRGSWWTGNFLDIFSANSWDFHDYLSEKFGSTVRVSGFFGAESLYTCDPLAFQHIFVKHQDVYEETKSFIVSNKMVFGPSLASSVGEEHRRQRKMLNPVFSLKHMRGLIPIFYPITHKLCDVLANEVRNANGKDINVMTWMSRAALEYIGQGGLGYSFDALDAKKTNKYSESTKMLSRLSMDLFATRRMLPFVEKLGPSWFRRKVFVDWSPSKSLRQIGNIVDTMDETSREVVEKKRQALARGEEEVLKQIGQGKDILSILLKANMELSESERMSESELLGHMNTFIFAGHDTSTAAISRILHQLTLHPNVQDRLRKEVTEARSQYGDLDYDTLMNLPYMDSVVRETLRVFPPAIFALRTTSEDITLPLAWPVRSADGKRKIDAIPLKKGTDIITSIVHANQSTRIWGPDAKEWKPERWLFPLPESVAKAHMPGVYASMMTFIGGSRSCIGFKLAEMEIKLVLSVLLETFVFSPGSREIQWYTTTITSPGVKGSKDTSPHLPLNVSFVKDQKPISSDC